MKTLWEDMRYSVRSLRKRLGFSSIVILTLAIGICANTTIFSVVNAVLLRALPYPHPERLLVLSQQSMEGEMAVSFPDYLDWRAQQSSYEDLAARLPAGGVITGPGEPERVIGRFVTASFFSTLGVQPAQGRSFTAAEDQPGANRVIILSHGLWQRRFGGRTDALGKI